MIDAAEESCLYINKYNEKSNIKCSVVVLVPTGDEIVTRYRHKAVIFEGSEDDVLSRYVWMAEEMNPDYVVRITSDCPLLPSYVISKCINAAAKNRLDYVSNVDENLRTMVDGFDVEVMSVRALEWLNTAATGQEREHVTLRLRSGDIPRYFRVAHVIGHLYQPNIKLSVDTQEDLERVRKEYALVKSCINKAIEKHGERSVFRI